MHILIDSVISATLHISIIDSLLIGIVAFMMSLPLVRKQSAKKKLWLLGVIVYASFLLFLTIPIILEPYPDSFLNKLAFVFPNILWNPIDSIAGVTSPSDFARLIVGNFCLLMPLSVLTLARTPNCPLKTFLALPALTSLAIEVMQFVGNVMIGYSSRTVETLDVILNTSGAWLCFLVAKSIVKIRLPRKGHAP